MHTYRRIIGLNNTATKTCILFFVFSFLLLGCTSEETTSTSNAVDRTITIGMYDTYFAPSTIDVKEGETIAFVFENFGALTHDAFLGDADAQDEHERMMQTGDSSMHNEHAFSGRHTPNIVPIAFNHEGGSEVPHLTLKPGKKAQFVYTFTDLDELIIGCHEAGHYAQNMRVTLRVSAP